MLFLVFSVNFFVTIIGWDGLGLFSFCLVIFYGNSLSLESGLVTVFRNRIGDVFFLVCFFLFSFRGWFRFDSFSFGPLYVLLVFLFFWVYHKKGSGSFFCLVTGCYSSPNSGFFFGSFFYFGYGWYLCFDSLSLSFWFSLVGFFLRFSQFLLWFWQVYMLVLRLI